MGKFALTVDDPSVQELRREGGEALAVTPEPTGGGAGSATAFVFRPGGTPAPGVFTTPSALKAALASVDPAADKVITVDTAHSAAHLTAADSPWPLDQATFQSVSGTELLNIDAGAIINATVLRLRNVQVLIGATSAAAIWTPPAGTAVLDEDGAVIANGSTHAWIDVASGVTFAAILNNASSIGVGAHALNVAVENGGASEVVSLGGSTVISGTFAHGAAAGGTLEIAYDGASQSTTSTTQDGANLTITVAPLMPVPNFDQTSGNTGTGTGTVAVPTPMGVKQTQTGKVLVTASISGETTSATTVTGQLVRDPGGGGSTNIGPIIVVTTLSANDAFALSVSFIDTLPDATALHTYEFGVTAGAGNLTVGAHSSVISALEIA